MDSRIFGILQRVQAEKDDGKREELMAKFNDELAAHFSHPSGIADLEELGFDLFQRAYADAAQGQDIVNQLIEVKTVGLAETDWIEDDLRGMRVYFQGKGGQIRSDIQRYERTFMPREEMVGAIDMHLDDVQTNFWGFFSKMQGQVQEKMRLAPADALIQLIQETIAAGDTYGSFAASTLADTEVDPILDEVAAKSGGQVTLFGTGLAIRKLANIGLDFGAQIQGRIFETGVIGTYKGYPVAQLDQYEHFEGDFALPDDEIWVIGKRAGRLTYYGNTPKVQLLRLPSFELRWETARDAGMALYGAAKGRVGRIVLT
jgi:hypothetical protein